MNNFSSGMCLNDKIRGLFVFLAFLVVQTSIGQSFLFNKVYPHPQNEFVHAVSLYELPSGNLFGIARHFNGAYYCRVNNQGVMLWDTLVRDDALPTYSIQRANGNYLISGNRDDLNGGVFIREIDSNGTVIWNQNNGLSNNSFDNSWMSNSKVVELQDSSIRLMFTAFGIPQWETDFPSNAKTRILRYSKSGSYINFIQLNNSYAGIKETSDSCLILTGTTLNTSGPSNAQQLLITKIGQNDSIVWSKVPVHSDTTKGIFPAGADIIEFNNSFVVVANSNLVAFGNSSPSKLYEFDFTGDFKSEIGFQNSNNNLFPGNGTFLLKTKDKGFIYGTSTLYCYSPPWCYDHGHFSEFYKYDSLIVNQWIDVSTSTWYGAIALNEGNNGLFGIGSTFTYEGNGSPTPITDDRYRLNIWNYDSLGNSLSDISQEDIEESNIKVYPNPLADEFYIESNNSKFIGSKITIRDIHGRIIRQLILENSKQKIDLLNLNSGVYFYTLHNKGITQRGKLIKK